MIVSDDWSRMAAASGYVDELRSAYSGGGSSGRYPEGSSAAHPNPNYPSWGISTEELAESQRRFCNYARFRITDTGSRQYSELDHQAFETMSPQRILLELRDEIADAVNYLAFLDIQLQRWQKRLEKIA